MNLLQDLTSVQARLRDGDTFTYVLFWGHRVPEDGTVVSTCMSQWYPLGFTIDGVYYTTAEHWMMACKARLFGDEEALSAILKANTPAKAKKLGRQVQNFDDTTWKAHARQFVTEGNYAKFTQHPRLRDFLLSTGDAILVEASPYDRIWGIGMGATHPNSQNPLEWRGTNLLGFALMDVRERIRGELKNSDV
jgi:ribA/ribD-fused uncharacterized protein